MTQILIRDPAYAPRDGWHSITDISGAYQDSLNGNIKRIFLTTIPINVPTSAARQPDNWSCGPYAVAEALNNNAEVNRQWLMARGYITSAYGSEHDGIANLIKAMGYDCTIIEGYYNGQMNPAVYQTLIAHMKKGYKVILLMGGLGSGAGGPCRNSYWSDAGHYVCAYDIKEDGSTTTTTITTNKTTTTSSTTWKATGTAYCNTNSVNVRATPNGTIIGQLNKNNAFEVDGKVEGDWVHIKVAGIGIGYMYKAYVTYNSTSTKTTTTSNIYSFNPAIIQVGSNNKSVLLCQEILKAKGLYTKELDSSFGGGTLAAVKAYQKQRKLTQDGVVGNNTWRDLLGL